MSGSVSPVGMPVSSPTPTTHVEVKPNVMIGFDVWNTSQDNEKSYSGLQLRGGVRAQWRGFGKANPYLGVGAVVGQTNKTLQNPPEGIQNSSAAMNRLGVETEAGVEIALADRDESRITVPVGIYTEVGKASGVAPLSPSEGVMGDMKSYVGAGLRSGVDLKIGSAAVRIYLQGGIRNYIYHVPGYHESQLKGAWGPVFGVGLTGGFTFPRKKAEVSPLPPPAEAAESALAEESISPLVGATEIVASVVTAAEAPLPPPSVESPIVRAQVVAKEGGLGPNDDITLSVSTRVPNISIQIDIPGVKKIDVSSMGPAGKTMNFKLTEAEYNAGAGKTIRPVITKINGTAVSPPIKFSNSIVLKPKAEALPVAAAEEPLTELVFNQGKVYSKTVDAEGITADQLKKAVLAVGQYNQSALSLKNCQQIGTTKVKYGSSVVTVPVVHMAINFKVYKAQWVIAMLPARRSGDNIEMRWALIPHTENADKTVFTGPYASKLNEYKGYHYLSYNVGGWKLENGQLTYWVSSDPTGLPGFVASIANNSGLSINLKEMIKLAKTK